MDLPREMVAEAESKARQASGELHNAAFDTMNMRTAIRRQFLAEYMGSLSDELRKLLYDAEPDDHTQDG